MLSLFYKISDGSGGRVVLLSYTPIWHKTLSPFGNWSAQICLWFPICFIYYTIIETFNRTQCTLISLKVFFSFLIIQLAYDARRTEPFERSRLIVDLKRQRLDTKKGTKILLNGASGRLPLFKEFHAYPGNLSTNRKRGIALAVLKRFWWIQKPLVLSG